MTNEDTKEFSEEGLSIIYEGESVQTVSVEVGAESEFVMLSLREMFPNGSRRFQHAAMGPRQAQELARILMNSAKVAERNKGNQGE